MPSILLFAIGIPNQNWERTKNQTHEGPGIIFVIDKLDNVTSDLQPKGLDIVYFSMNQRPPTVPDKGGHLQVSPEVAGSRAWWSAEQVAW